MLEAPSAAFRRGIRPAVRLPVDEWCERNVSLVDGRTPRFDLSQAPWQREPLRQLASNRNLEVVMVYPTGCGKSVLFEAWIAWIVSEDPGPLICAHQTKEPSQAWVEARVLPVIKKCGPVKELVRKMTTRRAEGEVVMPHMRLHFGGANKRFLQDHSKRYVLGQEVWDWTPGMLGEIKARTHDRYNRREVYCGQGGVVGSDFKAEWELCEQFEWQYKCPKCKKRHAFEWDQMRWDEELANDSPVDWEALGKSASYECKCGAKFKDREQTRRSLTGTGKYVSRGNRHKARHRGFTMNAMGIWWVEWGQLVQEFVMAQKEESEGNNLKMVAFKNKRLAQFYEVSSDTPDITPGDYSRKDYYPVEGKPAPRWVDETHRFLSIDVQKRHFWATLRAFKPGGSSRLLYEGKISTIEGVRDLQQRYEVPNWSVVIDSRYHPEDVARWRAKFAGTDPLDQWTMLMGEDQDRGYPAPARQIVNGQPAVVTIYRPFSHWVKSRTSDGIPYQFVKFSNLRIKDLLAGIMAGDLEFGVMSDHSEDYAKHMRSEVKREIRPGHMRWEKIKGHYRNDLRDCELMALVLACIKGVVRFES